MLPVVADSCLLLQHMVQTGMTPSPYATQFAQNGEAAGPLKAAEAGKEAPVVPGPPFSPPPATLPLNGIEQPSVTIVSNFSLLSCIIHLFIVVLVCVLHYTTSVSTVKEKY